MLYDFDTVIDRRRTGAVKYMPHPRFPEKQDLIPLWVADMDFQTAPPVREALRQTVDHGIYGYTLLDDAYYDAVQHWYATRFDLTLPKEWIRPVNSVLCAMAAALRALTAPNDGVLVLQPVYFPFMSVVRENGRRLVVSELAFDGERYTVDFADLEAKMAHENVKMLLFCSPHNPVGRVWTKEELARVCALCARYDIALVCDEIHADLTFRPHCPILSVPSAARTVALTSATKTFNVAGLQGANAFIPDPAVRRRVDAEYRSLHAGELSLPAAVALQAAYRQGAAWLDQLLAYLQGNVQAVLQGLADTPIRPLTPEGTYLMWLDCRALGLGDDELEAFFVQRCGVWMNNGYTFGKGGGGFMRLNVACPRATLQRALQRIRAGLQTL